MKGSPSAAPAYKRYLPRSLFGRALLILVLPVLLLQGVVSVLFIQRHYEGVTEQMAEAVANELDFAVRVVEEASSVEEAKARLRELSRPLGMSLELRPGDSVPSEALRLFYDLTGGVVAETFKHEVRNPLALDLVSFDKQVEARILTAKGVLVARIDRSRMIASNPHQLFVYTLVTSAALVAVAILFLRNQVRPIRELAEAADAFGKGRTMPFRPSGAEEVRRAGAAFLAMRARIERQIESRTRMLSGVSHDLRTPLTRLKLALAFLEDAPETQETAEEMARDVREMERMIEGFLDFARGEAVEEAALADPAALAQEVAAEARRGGREIGISLTVETPEAPTASMRRGMVKRALANLVENALAYGDRVEISLRLGPRAVEFIVEDDGPGVPEESRAPALRPFVRLDDARNQNRAGGVGLGLAVAAEVARAHGGALTLEDGRRLGGLCARLRLPR